MTTGEIEGENYLEYRKYFKSRAKMGRNTCATLLFTGAEHSHSHERPQPPPCAVGLNFTQPFKLVPCLSLILAILQILQVGCVSYNFTNFPLTRSTRRVENIARLRLP
jgi:hypothetical protein